jgi:NADH-quinone oxidoreductase subunit F
MPKEHRLILKHVDQPGYTRDIDCYLRHGGYEALKKALALRPLATADGKSLSGPEQIRREVELSGLRGRGGAGFACGMKWNFVNHQSGKPVYLICNADESEPGTFKDRQIIYKDPHQLIEGIVISSYANEAKLAYVYIRGEMHDGARILDRAIAEARQRGFLGPNILGSGYALELFRPSRGRRLHLRRGDRADRIARGQAPLSAHQTALFPRRARPLPVPDHRQQRRDPLPRQAHRRHGRQ